VSDHHVSRRRAAFEVAALAVVLVALAYSGWFRLHGGHWERVQTPSMGTAAPVGTLLWVEPVSGRVQPGEFVTFHRPDGGGDEVFSHRVTSVEPDGSFHTAGDLSGPDQWTVAPADLVGRVQWSWTGMGFLIQGAPVLVVGGLLTAGVVSFVARRSKLPLAMLGASFTLAAVMVVYHPLTGAESLGTADRGDGAVDASYVATGLLPVRISTHGDSVVLTPGESGTVRMTHVVDGKLSVAVKPAIPWWFWALLVLSCFGPSFGTGAVGTHTRHAAAAHRLPRHAPV
jgi:hypothetical protein